MTSEWLEIRIPRIMGGENNPYEYNWLLFHHHIHAAGIARVWAIKTSHEKPL